MRTWTVNRVFLYSVISKWNGLRWKVMSAPNSDTMPTHQWQQNLTIRLRHSLCFLSEPSDTHFSHSTSSFPGSLSLSALSFLSLSLLFHHLEVCQIMDVFHHLVLVCSIPAAGGWRKGEQMQGPGKSKEGKTTSTKSLQAFPFPIIVVTSLISLIWVRYMLSPFTKSSG